MLRLLHLTDFEYLIVLSLTIFPSFLLPWKFYTLLYYTLFRSYTWFPLFLISDRVNNVFTPGFFLGIRLAFRMRTVQGTVPHVWVDQADYTYKFASPSHMITTQVSLLFTSWPHPSLAYFRPIATLSKGFRRWPEPRSKIFPIYQTINLINFREPIRSLERQ